MATYSLFQRVRSTKLRPVSLGGAEKIAKKKVTTLPREAVGPIPVKAATAVKKEVSYNRAGDRRGSGTSGRARAENPGRNLADMESLFGPRRPLGGR